MKHALWIAAAVVAALIILALSLPQCAMNRATLAAVGDDLVHAEHAQLPLIRCGRLAITARHNHAVIQRASDYVATIGSGTGLFMELATISAEAPQECPLLEAVLDLAVRSTNGGPNLIDLAQRACQLDEAEWWAYHDRVAEWATYETVEAAVAARSLRS